MCRCPASNEAQKEKTKRCRGKQEIKSEQWHYKMKGGDFPVVPNCSYAWHNTSMVPVDAYPTVEKQNPRKMVPNKAYGVHTVFPSMKVPVYPNEAYGVCKGVTHDKEPVYEMVK